jgi:nitrite reductase/ring-hydroxylating ferredoxin subunit
VTEFTSIGSLSQFQPGALTEMEAGGKRLLVVSAGGTLYALSSVCPHSALPLSGGWLDGGSLVCPFHGSAFQLATGEGVQGPATGDAIEVNEVRVEGDDVLVAIDSPQL